GRRWAPARGRSRPGWRHARRPPGPHLRQGCQSRRLSTEFCFSGSGTWFPPDVEKVVNIPLFGQGFRRGRGGACSTPPIALAANKNAQRQLGVFAVAAKGISQSC